MRHIKANSAFIELKCADGLEFESVVHNRLPFMAAPPMASIRFVTNESSAVERVILGIQTAMCSLRVTQRTGQIKLSR